MVYKNPNSDVELSIIDKQRPFDIFLDDERILLDLA